MFSHFDFSDTEFEQRFIECTLDPSYFSHEAHLRLAWIQIENYRLENAITNIEDKLQNFVAHVEAKDKYHKTLTIAAVKTVNHFKKKSKSTNFKSFIEEFPRLNNSFKELIGQHYSFDIYNSKQAKAEFLEPDLLKF